MANNSEIAYKIYKTIKDKQDEQIRLGTIKESDIIELYEGNFIENLHNTIQFQMSAFSDLKPEILSSVISSTYVNILESIENITDFKDLSFSDGIRIPNEIIKLSINNAISKNEDRMQNNTITTPIEQIATMAMIAKFSEFETVEEKMNFFDSLTKDEQQKFTQAYTEKVMGKKVAEERKKYVDELERFRNSKTRQHMTEEQVQEFEENFMQKNPLNNKLKLMGITSYEITDLKSEIKILDFMKQVKDAVKDGTSQENIISTIKSLAEKTYNLKLNLGEIEAFIQNICEHKNNIDEYIDNLGLTNQIVENGEQKKIINDNIEFIIQMAKKAIPGISDEIIEKKIYELGEGIFINGKIDFYRLLYNLETRLEGTYQINFDRYENYIPKMEEGIKGLREAISDRSEGLDDVQLLTLYGNAIDENGNVNLTRLDELSTDEVTDFVLEVSTEDFMTDMGDFLGITFEENMLAVGMGDLMMGDESQPLPEEVAAELQAIPVALQRINCQPEDIAKGMEAYKQIIDGLSPEEIEGTQETITQTLKKKVEELGLDGVVGDILDMMSQITFNGQITEILKNCKAEFLNSLETLSMQGPLLDPRVFAVNPEQYSNNAVDERIDENALKAGFSALAVDLQIAEQTIIRPEELVADSVNQREDGQVEMGENPIPKEGQKESPENKVIKKLQTFFGVFHSARTSEQDLEEEMEMLENLSQRTAEQQLQNTQGELNPKTLNQTIKEDNDLEQ